MTTQRDLSLAYSPGVAVPCLRIAEDPVARLRLHRQGQSGRGHLQRHRDAGPGRSRRAGLQAGDGRQGGAVQALRRHRFIDIEVDTDGRRRVHQLRALSRRPPSAASTSRTSRRRNASSSSSACASCCDIPVFHDDQHGTAIISAAGLINALHLTGRDIEDIKLVVQRRRRGRHRLRRADQGHGRAATTTSSWCDTKGVIYHGRTEGMNQWKSAHAVRHQGAHPGRRHEGRRRVHRPFGQGRGDARRWSRRMAPKPIIFAMANPDPEITPEEVRAVRQDAIVATGRSDYPNQVNNVLGFPYIFRGALDVRARTINDEMKIAAAQALADAGARGRARRGGCRLSGRAAALWPRLHHPGALRSAPDLLRAAAVAQAAMETGVARKPIARHGRLPRRASAPARPHRRRACS